MLGTYEFSDFPMNEATYGVKLGQHIPGAVVHRYLTDYAKHFAIFNSIRFGMNVITAEHQIGATGGWKITCSKNELPEEFTIMTPKLIVATGLTSEQTLPKIIGSDSFGVPMFHCKNFKTYADTIKTANSVCVLGGTKVCYEILLFVHSQTCSGIWIAHSLVSNTFLELDSLQIHITRTIDSGKPY